MQNYKFLLTLAQELAEICYKKLQIANFSAGLLMLRLQDGTIRHLEAVKLWHNGNRRVRVHQEIPPYTSVYLKYLPTVIIPTEPRTQAQPDSEPRRPQIPTTPKELIAQGTSFLSGLAATLQSPEATEQLVNSLIETDAETGQTSLKNVKAGLKYVLF